MSDQQKITQYIDNLSLKKSVFGKVPAKDVQEVICELSSMYNEMLADVYNENERLKRLIEEMDGNGTEIERANSECELVNIQNESSDKMREGMDSQVNCEEKKATVESSEPLAVEEENGLIDKDLRKFKRTELLEILLDQSRENESQKKQIEDLKQTIADLQKQLADRTIRVEKAGTIAEAAFVLNGVYDSTQAAAQQYLDSLAALYEREQKNVVEKEARTEAYVKMRLEEVENACNEKEKRMADRCAALEQATRERCEFMKEDIRQQCMEMEERTRVKCELREKEAEEKCSELDQKAKSDVEKRWDVLSTKLEEFYLSHDGLRERLAMTGENQSE